MPDQDDTSKSDKRDKTFRVVFICTGNTCRSPMAEGILRKLTEDDNGDNSPISVTSAGTMGMTGAPATKNAIAVAQEYGIDLSKHRSQGITAKLMAESDLIFALATDHYSECRRREAAPARLFMLRAFPQQSSDMRADSIADPIGGGASVYERAFFQIDEAIRRAWPEILSRAKDKSP